MIADYILYYPFYKGLAIGFIAGFSFYVILNVLLSLPHYWWQWWYNRRMRRIMRRRVKRSDRDEE